jgi:hypothetical protein
MPYTATAWTNGVTPLNQTNLNNLETQYTEAVLSHNPDLFTSGFFLSGFAATGTVGTTTVNVAAGTAYLLQADGTTRQRKQNATTQTTSTPSTTYHLYLQPDNTFYWSTSNSPATNSLAIANVTTNVSGQIATITDLRPTAMILLAGGIGTLELNPNNPSTATHIGLSYITQNDPVTQVQDAVGLLGRSTADASSRFNLRMRSTDGYGQLGLAGPNGANLTNLYGSSAGLHSSGKLTVDASGLTVTAGGATVTAGGLTVTAGATSLDGAKITTDGTNGTLTKIGNQATAGSFGVPVIVAQGPNVAITDLLAHTIATFTPSADGDYRASATVTVNGTANAAALQLQWTDPNTNSANVFSMLGNVTTTTVGQVGNAGFPVSFPVYAMTFRAKSGVAINIKYQQTAGVANDHVSGYIERLS